MNFYLNGYDYEHIPSTKKFVDIINPVTNELLQKISLAEEEDAELILSSAEEGFKNWRNKPLYERAKIIYAFADLLEKNSENIAQTMSKNMGRAIKECQAEVTLSVNLTRGFVEKAKHMYGNVLPESQEGLENDIIFTKREPLGVITCIIPFNAPVELFIHKVIPALIMGNSVIVKASTSDPLPQLLLADILIKSGAPKEVIQMVYSKGSFISNYITKDERISAITFTGSTEVGTSIYEEAAPELHRIFLEMGGNDPLIILSDADIDYAVEELVKSRMMNAGQVCCSSKRTLVPKSIFNEVEQKIKKRLSNIKQGDPLNKNTEVGSIINQESANKVKKQIDLTLSQGGRCSIGGNIKHNVFIEPTLLVDITKDMDVAKDMEIFGPVITLIEYDELEEAIDIANQTSYGLQASIIGKDVSSAIAIAHEIQAGAVIVNGAGSYRHIDMAFGGYKNSGIGREGISATLQEFSQEKSFVIKNAKSIR